MDHRVSRNVMRALLMRMLWLGLIGLVAGCSSKPTVDWGSRVGSYTYDQAILEMGPPDRSTRLSDGATVADWYRGGAPSVTFGFGVGSYGPGGGVGVGQGVTTGGAGRYLRLSFDAGGTLIGADPVTR